MMPEGIGTTDQLLDALRELASEAELNADDNIHEACQENLLPRIEKYEAEANERKAWWCRLLVEVGYWWYLRKPSEEAGQWPYAFMVNDRDGDGMRRLVSLVPTVEKALPLVAVTRLKARLSELCAAHHEPPKREEYLATAYEAYIGSGLSDDLVKGGYFTDIDHLERAFEIARLLDKGHPRSQRRKQLVERFVEFSHRDRERNVPTAYRLAQIAQSYILGQRTETAEIATLKEAVEHEAKQEEAQGRWLPARDSWRLRVALERKRSRVLYAQIHAATCADREGNRRATEPNSNLAAAHWLEEAEAEYRKVASDLRSLGKDNDEVSRLTERATELEREAQRLTAEGIEKETFSVPWFELALNEPVARVHEALDGIEGLMPLWGWFAPSTLAKHEEQANKIQEQRGVLAELMPITPIGPRNRRERTITPGTEAHKREMLKYAIVQNIEIRGAIMQEALARRDWTGSKYRKLIADAVEAMTLVSEKQKDQLLTGLIRPLDRDWMGATALLLPLIEEFLRRMLERRGQSTVATKRTGDQRQYILLPAALRAAERTKVLSTDSATELQIILTMDEPHSTGHNLRNRVLHGFGTTNDLQGPIAAWLWGKVLRWSVEDTINE